jgi:hypothetical protein
MNLIVCPYKFLSEYVAKENKNIIDHLVRINDYKIIDIEEPDTKISFESLMKKNNIDLTQIKLVLFFETYYNFVAIECNKYKFKKIYVIGDLHNPRRISAGSFNCDILFANYHYLIKNYLEDNKIKKSYFLPHSAINDFDCDFNNNPVNKILISGALNKDIYPLRDYLIGLNKDLDFKGLIDYFKHPGYRSKTTDCKYYAQEINKYLCCFTDCAKDYLLLKFFEIPATGSLLLCEVNDVTHPIMNNLGFIDMENCVFCNKDNLKQKIKYILDPKNRDEIDRIRINGKLLIINRHSAEHRAKYINDIIYE